MLAEINKRIIVEKKAGNKFEASALILVKSELLNNGKAAKPKAEEDVVKSYAKKLTKSLDQFKNTPQHGNLVKEIDIVKSFLPAEMTEEEIKKEVIAFLVSNPEENHAGKITGMLKKQFPNADGSLLSKLIRDNLN